MFDRFSSVQLLSRVQLFATLWTAACQASLSFTISRNLLTPMSAGSVMPSNHLVLCRPLLLLPLIFPSIRVFSNESVNQMATVLELQLQHQSFQWIFRISFRVNRLDGLAVQGALKSLLQHNLKASILRCSSLWSNSHTHTWLLEKS